MANYAAQGGLELKADMGQFHRIFTKSSPIDKALQAGLRKNLRDAAKKVAQYPKVEVLKAPVNDSRNTASTGLRKNIADSIKVRINSSKKSASVSIVAAAPLSKQYDGSARWRHPVFGNTQVWVTQTGRPFFASTISPHRDEVTKAVLAAMQTAINSLR